MMSAIHPVIERTMPLSPDAPTSAELKRDDAVAAAEAILARARADCIAAGVTPAQLAKLLLPEALLALMIEGSDERHARAVFADFVDHEIGEWYERVRGAAERCDCAIDHASELRLASAGTLADQGFPDCPDVTILGIGAPCDKGDLPGGPPPSERDGARPAPP